MGSLASFPTNRYLAGIPRSKGSHFMETEGKAPDIRSGPSLKTLAAFSIPYGFVLASCYLAGYWNPLGLNPFQYANAADLSSATIAGIWGALAVLAIGGLIGVYGSPAVFVASKALRDFEHTKYPKSKLKQAGLNVLALLIIALVVVAIWKGDKFIRAVAMGTFFSSLVLAYLGLRKNLDISEPAVIRTYGWAVLIILIMPIFTWKLGNDAIAKALRASTGMTLDVTRSALPMKTQGRVVYVGMLGEFHVAQAVDSNSTLLLPSSTSIVFQAPKPVAN